MREKVREVIRRKITYKNALNRVLNNQLANLQKIINNGINIIAIAICLYSVIFKFYFVSYGSIANEDTKKTENTVMGPFPHRIEYE